jgi:hypothetical protein
MIHTDRIIQEMLKSRPDRVPCIEQIDPMMVEVLQQKTPAERLAIAWGLWEFARTTLRRQVAAQHPDWTEYEVHREATRRLVHEP